MKDKMLYFLYVIEKIKNIFNKKEKNKRNWIY